MKKPRFFEEVAGIYKITNLITGQIYIGSSKNIRKRCHQHRHNISTKRIYGNDYSVKKPLYIDMRKYGLDNFEMEIVEITDNLLEREQYYIDLLKPFYNKNNPIVNLEEAKKKAREYSKKYAKNHPRNYKEYYAKKKGMTLEEFELYKENRHKKAIENRKEIIKKYTNKYNNQICLYKGKKYKLVTLAGKLKKEGIEFQYQEAKKYIIENMQ